MNTEHPCYVVEDGCEARFKTKHGMLTHATTCPFNYENTSQYYEVEKILTVYKVITSNNSLRNNSSCATTANKHSTVMTSQSDHSKQQLAQAK